MSNQNTPTIDNTNLNDGDPMTNTEQQRPHLYNPDGLLVVHDITQPHWLKASIPPVNAWAERLDAEASSRDDIYRNLKLTKVHMGVGDANVGIGRDELIAAIDLLVFETKRHNRGSFGFTHRQSDELFSYFQSFPEDGTSEDRKQWRKERPTELLEMIEHAIPDVGFPYGKMTGWGPALEAHKAFFQRHVGVEARDHFCITSGDRNAVLHATHAVRQHMLATNRPKFLLITPSWGTYEVIITEYYGNESLVTMECSNGIPDSEKVDEILAENKDIGCMLMCNPNNPSGDVLGSSRLVNLGQVLYKHRVPIISDELYMLFVYDREHRSMARAAGELWKSERHHEVGRWLANNIMVLGVGVQKVIGSGIRCSAAWIPNTHLRSRFVASQGASTGQPAILSQAIATAVISSKAYDRGYSEMRLRRDAMLMMLSELKTDIADTHFTLEHSAGEGAFYLAVYLAGLVGMEYVPHLNGQGKIIINTSEDLAMWLVDQAAVIGSPASTALIKDPRFVRLSYGNVQREHIPIAGKQIATAIKMLARTNGRTT